MISCPSLTHKKGTQGFLSWTTKPPYSPEEEEMHKDEKVALILKTVLFQTNLSLSHFKHHQLPEGRHCHENIIISFG